MWKLFLSRTFSIEFFEAFLITYEWKLSYLYGYAYNSIFKWFIHSAMEGLFDIFFVQEY